MPRSYFFLAPYIQGIQLRCPSNILGGVQLLPLTSLLIQIAAHLVTLENLVQGAWHAHPMENGCRASHYIWESPTILWLNYGVLERHWLELGLRAITEFIYKLILFLRTTG